MRYTLALILAGLVPVGASFADTELSGSALFYLEDFKGALEKLKTEAQAGDAWAQTNLGLMYAKGQSVLQDYAEAKRLYLLAAAQGNAQAQHQLAILYTEGQGVIQDFQSAHLWYNISCASGYAISCTLRDFLAKEMIPADVSEAQRRARACMKSSYTDCDP